MAKFQITGTAEQDGSNKLVDVGDGIQRQCFKCVNEDNSEVMGLTGDCLGSDGIIVIPDTPKKFKDYPRTPTTILQNVVHLSLKDIKTFGLPPDNNLEYFVDLDFTNLFDFKWNDIDEPRPIYYDLNADAALWDDSNKSWIPSIQLFSKIYYYTYDINKNLRAVGKLVSSGGSGFSSRADRPVYYLWYGDQKVGVEDIGLEAGLYCGDLSKDPDHPLLYQGITYHKTNTPRFIKKQGAPASGSGTGVNANVVHQRLLGGGFTEDVQKEKISYYKGFSTDWEVVREIKPKGNNTISWKRGPKSDPSQSVSLYERAPAVPKIPLVPSYTPPTYKQAYPNLDEGFLVELPSRGQPQIRLFSNKSPSEFKRSDFGTRKKAKGRTLGLSKDARTDTGRVVFKALTSEDLKKGVQDYVAAWRSQCFKVFSTEKGAGSAPPKMVFPATGYLNFILQSEQFKAFSGPLELLNEWPKLSKNFKDKFWYAPCSQEWCHLQGHRSGGPDEYFNFVSGSHYANTEQLAIETAHNQKDFLGHFTVNITAYTFGATDVALWIRYKIYNTGKKVFEHVFDGQGESFDKNEFNILKFAVEQELKKIAVPMDAD